MSGEPDLEVKSWYFTTFTHFLMNIFSKSIALVAWQASQVHRVHWIEIFICLHRHSSKTGPRYHQKPKRKRNPGLNKVFIGVRTFCQFIKICYTGTTNHELHHNVIWLVKIPSKSIFHLIINTIEPVDFICFIIFLGCWCMISKIVQSARDIIT